MGRWRLSADEADDRSGSGRRSYMDLWCPFGKDHRHAGDELPGRSVGREKLLSTFQGLRLDRPEYCQLG